MKKHTHRTWLSVLSMAFVCVLLFGLTACGGKQTPAETTAGPAMPPSSPVWQTGCSWISCS